MRAVRVASPEGWQVSVRCSLIGVERGVVVDGGWTWGLWLGQKCGGWDLGPLFGVVLGHCYRGRGEQC